MTVVAPRHWEISPFADVRLKVELRSRAGAPVEVLSQPRDAFFVQSLRRGDEPWAPCVDCGSYHWYPRNPEESVVVSADHAFVFERDGLDFGRWEQRFYVHYVFDYLTPGHYVAVFGYSGGEASRAQPRRGVVLSAPVEFEVRDTGEATRRRIERVMLDSWRRALISLRGYPAD